METPEADQAQPQDELRIRIAALEALLADRDAKIRSLSAEHDALVAQLRQDAVDASLAAFRELPEAKRFLDDNPGAIELVEVTLHDFPGMQFRDALEAEQLYDLFKDGSEVWRAYGEDPFLARVHFFGYDRIVRELQQDEVEWFTEVYAAAIAPGS
jgi:hypothetical protein